MQSPNTGRQSSNQTSRHQSKTSSARNQLHLIVLAKGSPVRTPKQPRLLPKQLAALHKLTVEPGRRRTSRRTCRCQPRAFSPTGVHGTGWLYMQEKGERQLSHKSFHLMVTCLQALLVQRWHSIVRVTTTLCWSDAQDMEHVCHCFGGQEYESW